MRELFTELKKKPRSESGHQLFLDTLLQDCIETNIQIDNKKELFSYISQKLAVRLGNISQTMIEKALWKREKTQNTSVGHALALPHARLDILHSTRLAIFTTKQPMDYECPTGEKINVFIVTLGPSHESHVHLEILTVIAYLVENSNFLQELSSATNNATALKATLNALDTVPYSL